MGSLYLMGFSSIVGRICMEKSLTNGKWKHDVGCKAIYAKNSVNAKFGAFHGNATPPISSDYD